MCQSFLADYSAGRFHAVEERFAPKALVAIHAVDSDDQRILTAKEFLSLSLQKIEEGATFLERISGKPLVLIDDKIATVWTPYEIESNKGKASGIDIFQFIQLEGKWRIVSLTYSNRKKEE